MMPHNSGYILWVSRAHGPFWGWVNAMNCMFSNLFDNSIYPVLALEYYVSQYPSSLTSTEQYVAKLAVVFLGVGFNLCGIEHIGNLATMLTPFILVPVFIGFIIAFPHISPQKQWFVRTDQWWEEQHVIPTNLSSSIAANYSFGTSSGSGDAPVFQYDYTLFVSSALWLYTGWDGLGNVAAEVKDGHATYFRALMVAMVIAIGTYLVPVIAALTLAANVGGSRGSANAAGAAASRTATSEIWGDGYLTVAYERLMPGLGFVMTICAAIGSGARSRSWPCQVTDLYFGFVSPSLTTAVSRCHLHSPLYRHYFSISR
jgi:amino acid transporter